MSNDNVCGNCKWWSADRGEYRGMCIAMPPTVVRDPARAKLIAASPYTGRDRCACMLWRAKDSGDDGNDGDDGWGWWK